MWQRDIEYLLVYLYATYIESFPINKESQVSRRKTGKWQAQPETREMPTANKYGQTSSISMIIREMRVK